MPHSDLMLLLTTPVIGGLLLFISWQTRQILTLIKKLSQPIGQIDLSDHKTTLGIYVVNNGLGPMTIKSLRFKNDAGSSSARIDHLIDIPPSSYNHVTIDDSVLKTLLPKEKLILFEKTFDDVTTNSEAQRIRAVLSVLEVTVTYADMLQKEYSIKRHLTWFITRHQR